MAWREQDDSRDFNPHAGRDAFRGELQHNPTPAERAASFRAMRSFTESIECDLPPAPELPLELDIDHIEGMKTSDTNDTIIEVVTSSSVDPCLGETQKYKMAVPGPGHSEQEHELHKSLIQAEDEELDNEIETAMTKSASAEKAPPPSAFSRHVPDADHAALRKEMSTSAVQRRRPTTPTSACTLETIAFISGEPEQQKKEEKIKVSIPSGRRRKSDMPYSDFYDNMAQQIPGQARGSASGRTTPLNGYDGDILEENPYYRDKVPPAPAIHRRTSIEWENFEDMQEKMDASEPPPKPNRQAVSQEDEEPTFSEDMQEERAKVKKSRRSTSNSVSDIRSESEDHVVPQIEEAAMTEREKTPEATSDAFEEEETPTAVVFEFVKPRKQASNEVKEVETMEAEPVVQEPEVEQQPSEVQPTPVHFELSEDQPAHHEEATTNGTDEAYDPNAYPGYIWNYDTQQWDVDPHYDASQHPAHDYSAQDHTEGQYDYSQQYGYDQTGNYDPATYDQGATEQQPAYDQSQYDASAYPAEGSYDQSAYQSNDPYNAGYDQGTAQYDASAYDYTTAAYHVGYDQEQATTAAYDANAAYDQSTAGYDYSQQYAEGTYDQGATAYDQSGYDQSGAYDQAAYDQSTAGYDQGAVATGQEATVYDQTTNYDQQQYDYSAYNYDQSYQQEGYGDTYPTENGAEPSTTVEDSYSQQPPPPPPAFITPVFQSVPKPADPFGWESHEAPSSTAAGFDSSPAPSRPAPPSRPQPPKSPAHGEEPTSTAPSAPPPRPPPAAKAAPPRPNAPHPAKLPEKEDDAWTQFKKMTDKVNVAVKCSEEQLKTLSETSAANDIKDESYLAQIGGEQGYVHNATQKIIQEKMEEQKNAKLLKKKLKQQGKKAASPTFDPDEEDNMDRAAQELAAKMAAKLNMEGYGSPFAPIQKKHEEIKREDSLSAIPPRKRSSLKEVQQDSGGSLELPAHLSSQQRDSIAPKGDLDPDDPTLSAPAWADFDTSEPVLPPSESGFFSSKEPVSMTAESATESDAFGTSTAPAVDPFAPPEKSLIDDDYDPFAIQPVEDIMAAAKAKAEEAQQAHEARQDVDFFGGGRQSPTLSTPTPEGGSPLSHRPQGFEDDFKCEAVDGDTPTPLYDEDDSEPLTDFIPKYSGDGWDLMVRHPIKKKSFMAERCWKPCHVKITNDGMLRVYNDKKDNKPIQELLLQATYSLSDTTLQAYDIYGKIHTVKLQFVEYKEKVGIRPGQISRLVEGHVTKYGLPLEHSAQCQVLLKFGSLHATELQSFVTTMEDILFKCTAKREKKPIYKQDEVQIHCYDEYSASVDKDGLLSDQRARVRLFCLAFVTGSPFLEIGLNDRRRQGKEIVRRKDILPMYTERWIRFENLEFHNTVDRAEFDKEQVIRLSPPDGCFFEIMRFRIRPPRNREKALNVKCIMKIAGSKVEIRLEVMAAAQVEKSKGGKSTRRQIPCEDIAIRFPIPEAWIYIFREERHWGVGSVHSKKLRPGKVKNLKDRLLGAVQSNDPNLIEVAIGEAKYEHVYRSLVWRIPRLPEKHHQAYKAHLLKCRFELSSFDLMPETFLPRCDVDFTMPLATVSNTVVRSVSVEQHEDSDRVEKFVRYVAKCQYKVEIDYVQCADLEVDTMDPMVNPDEAMTAIPQLHQPTFQPSDVQQMHDGYGIAVPDNQSAMPRDDSSSDDDDDKTHKMPIIQIDMKNYGY